MNDIINAVEASTFYSYIWFELPSFFAIIVLIGASIFASVLAYLNINFVRNWLKIRNSFSNIIAFVLAVMPINVVTSLLVKESLFVFIVTNGLLMIFPYIVQYLFVKKQDEMRFIMLPVYFIVGLTFIYINSMISNMFL